MIPKVTIIFVVLLGFTPQLRAHDPYEITSVAYVRSNRIEVSVEMEFPTGMTLAGRKPVRDVSTITQFEAAMPQLLDLAGNFFAVTAGNNAVQPLSTNVALGVEDHISFQIHYAPSPHRPLRFVARGLEANAGENPYGTSLTVLDMVNMKVLGQVTLFAASPTAEFPPRNPEVTETFTPPESSAPALSSINTQTTPQPASTNAAPEAITPNHRLHWLTGVIALGVIILIGLALLRRQ